MSHTTKLKSVSIKDINALRSAVSELQESGVTCHLSENTAPRMFYKDQHGPCPYTLCLTESKYDVGFELQEDGSYAPVFDTFANYVGKQIGATCAAPNTPEGIAQKAIGKLMQSYAKHAAINAAISQGYFVESSSYDEKGNLHLVVAGM